MALMKEIKIKDNVLVRIHSDESPESPREWDNLGEMICFHKRYCLGDKHKYSSNDFEGWDEMKKQLIKDYDAVVILPLYMYDHSGVTINTTGFSCRWDSGQIGFILASKKSILESYGVKKITKKTIERVNKCLLSEVKVYDDYLRGDVYGYQIVELEECEDCHHVSENITDSCWGFFGDDFKNNGMFDYIPEEYHKVIEAEI